MFRKELHLFFTALMFFTRIPCPSWVRHDGDSLNQARKYFPLVGIVVGAICAFVYGLTQGVFSVSIALLLSMVAGVWTTGAFHEDGFADSCDGFGGGWTKEQVLKIMKDSRIGTYGTVGLVSILGLKFVLLQELTQYGLWFMLYTLISGHSLSRWMAALVVERWEYVQDSDKSKSKPIASAKFMLPALLYSAIWGFLPLLLFQDWRVGFALPAGIWATLGLGRYFYKRIGGYTGDCLGAAQQINEVVYYMTLIIVWKFI